MPESKCGDCEETHWSPTQEKLMKWELEHHKKSFKKSQPGSLGEAVGIEGFHDCRLFQERDDETKRLIAARIYNYNKLVEVIDF